MLNRFIYLLLICCCTTIGSAQPSLSFTRISTESGLGLFSNVIGSLHQDTKGFIWVGTGNGLQRFDGNKFINVATGKPGSEAIPHSMLSQIMDRGDGKLLLGFEQYNEIGLFDPADFSYHKVAVDLPKPRWPRGEFVMVKGGGGQLFLNIEGDDILHYNTATNRFVNDHFYKLPGNAVINHRSGMWYDAMKRQMWFAHCSGLSIYDEDSRQMWHKENNPRHLAIFNHPEIQDCPIIPYVDKQRRIWMMTWGKKGQWPHCFDSTGSYTLTADTAGIYDGPMGYAEYRYFFETRSGELWVHGANTLFNFDRSTGRFHYNLNNARNPSRGITCDGVYQMMEDRDNNVWIGTDKGLFYCDRNSNTSSVINFMLDESRTQLSITDMMEMPDKSIWLSLWGQGIKVIDSNFNESRHILLNKTRTPLPKDWSVPMQSAPMMAWSICHRKTNGKLLIGCQAGVLMEYDPVTDTALYLKPPECENSTVLQVVEDANNTVWLGTHKGVLIKWEHGVFSKVFDPQSLIKKLFIDRQGWLWIITINKGVFAFDTQTGKVLQHYTRNEGSNSLYTNGGTDVEQLNDSVLVVASGAIEFINKRTKKIALLQYEDGLPSNSAVRLRVDNDGFLWIVTNNGLCRYNPANGRIDTYGRKDGVVLASNTNSTDMITAAGQIVFGGGASVILFSPAAFKTGQPPSKVTVTDFKLFNQYLPVDSLLHLREIRLQPAQNSFSIYFSTLSYAQKDRLSYYYQMEGIDKRWVRADVSNYVSYSLLPPGHYTFKVYAETIDGRRSQVTELLFYIHPPFWRTRWFITLVVLSIAFIAYAIHKARIGKILAMEKLRSRVARDLHDDMGSTLSTINILSAMAKTKMGVDTVKTSEYLTKISDNSQRMMEAMDDIVWSIKPSNDSLQKITARMREFATSVLEAKDIELQFEVEEDVCNVKLDMAARRDFFLVFKEAVNNAAKYSRATQMFISVSCKNRRLIMRIKDNGMGFVINQADSGNGLSNMEKRTESMNGKIRITSALGAGTEVLISIPVS